MASEPRARELSLDCQIELPWASANMLYAWLYACGLNSVLAPRVQPTVTKGCYYNRDMTHGKSAGRAHANHHIK